MTPASPPKPAPFPPASEEVLTEYSRPVAHLRERFRARRLGLVLGAGFGRNLGLPACGDLLCRVVKEFRTPFAVNSQDNPSRQAQFLFQHYRRYECADAEPKGLFTREDVIRSRWLHLIHRCLYRDVPGDPAEFERRSPYLHYFVPLLKDVRLTISYGFDNTLERLLALPAHRQGEPGRGPASLWGANPPTPPDGVAVYHPNGFLPSPLRADQPGEDLVLLPSAFAAKPPGRGRGRFALLTAYLADRTCLIVGSSLTDPTLQHALRHVARVHPGHVHYFVRYVRGAGDVCPQRREAEFEANFADYNLLTLFLTSEGIAALAALVGVDETAFREFTAGSGAGREGRLHRQFVYYLVGASGVGKTTTLRHLYSLRAHEEWPDPLLDLMTRNYSTLTKEQLGKVDRWVDKQWRRKNAVLAAAGSGIDVVDRGPLDALAYVPLKNQAARAEQALAAIRKARVPVTPGHVIRLCGDDRRVQARALRAFRKHDLRKPGGIVSQQRQIARLYGVADDDPNTVCIDGLSPGEVARRVARIVHTQPYRPTSLGDLLANFARG
jgi:predicted ATPase